MTLLYHDRRFLDHHTGQHPERAERLAAIQRRLEEGGLSQRCRQPSCEPISDRRLLRLHDEEYVQRLRAFSEHGGGQIEVDTLMSRASYEVARLAAGAACDAVQRVLAGEDRNALALVRPPGHHALADRPMGFCLFNNVALAARVALDEFELDRVLIVDWDVHHGNGTQDVFWEDEQVGYFSIHRWPFYPGTGAADERGAGPGLGATLNVPVKFSTPREDYQKMFAGSLESFADWMRPQLVLVSAGFDAHRADPIGSLGLETEDFGELTRVVLRIAAAHAQGRVVSVLEGGYNPPVLADCVALHLETLLEAAPA